MSSYTMSCSHCHLAITPGAEIEVGIPPRGTFHCPYCLGVLLPQGVEQKGDEEPAAASVQRFVLRRRTREQLVDRLLRQSEDGRARCPVCEHALNTSDEILLRSSEYFRCHCCYHDLATVAYRSEAYDPRRWLPVIYAVGDLRADSRCARCAYLGAMARACQQALSWIPQLHARPSALLVNVLARQHWTLPEEDCLVDCLAARQYRVLAGEGLTLL